MNARIIQTIIIVTLGVFIAIWLGMALVTDQFETILKVAGAAFFLTAVFLGRRVWLMFVFLVSVNVVLYRWFGTVEIGQLIFIGFSLVLFLMHKLQFRIRFGELEVWALLIIACVVQTYVRHPVGMNILGSGNVGGRPYFAIALCVVSAAILSALIVPPKELKWALHIAIIGGFLGIPLQAARYGNMTSLEGGSMDLSGEGAGSGRIGSFSGIGNVLARLLTCRMSPLRACRHPLWALVLLASVAFAAASGYRNAVASVGFIHIIAIYYHGGFKSLIASIFMGALFLSLLALVNLNFPLPGNLQRALSPLPGTWEERYIKGGELSTEWRVEMWKEALFTDRWIDNKLLGDGIGVSSAQLDRQVNLRGGGGDAAGGLSNQQVTMLELGSYHSGPVHSVRMVGYVGLLVLLLAMIRLAVHCHRQIMRCKGTEWAPVALFFGIIQIAQPFF
ncbi:MAG: hypothetical protein H8M99_11430, partial [Gloeobacteraceae cyanobacterium ES-bin-144]|nr:hypothetical protein [Verrucomicrobiales bacterium]